MIGSDDIDAVTRHLSIASSQRDFDPHAGCHLFLHLLRNAVIIRPIRRTGKSDPRSNPVTLIVQLPRLGRRVEQAVLVALGDRIDFQIIFSTVKVKSKA